MLSVAAAPVSNLSIMSMKDVDESKDSCVDVDSYSLMKVHDEYRRWQRYDGDIRLVCGTVPFLLLPHSIENSCSVSISSTGVLLFCLCCSSSDRIEFIFPKGGWESHESSLQAAKRETEEEAGLQGQCVTDLEQLTFEKKKNLKKKKYQKLLSGSSSSPTLNSDSSTSAITDSSAEESTSPVLSPAQSFSNPKAKQRLHMYLLHVQRMASHYMESQERRRFFVPIQLLLDDCLAANTSSSISQFQKLSCTKKWQTETEINTEDSKDNWQTISRLDPLTQIGMDREDVQNGRIDLQKVHDVLQLADKESQRPASDASTPSERFFLQRREAFHFFSVAVKFFLKTGIINENGTIQLKQMQPITNG